MKTGRCKICRRLVKLEYGVHPEAPHTLKEHFRKEHPGEKTAIIREDLRRAKYHCLEEDLR